jgi:hypothetical protein
MRGAIYLLLLLNASLAHAGGLGGIPAGSGWFCFTAQDPYNPRDRAGDCFRSEAECDAMRSTWSENNSATTATDLTACLPQKNAAVITYYDVMREESRYWAVPSSALCTETKRYLAKDEDNRNVSACRLVGDVPFPAGKFRSSLIPAGTGWQCSREGKHAYSVCERDLAPCAAAASESGDQTNVCRLQKVAFALTWDDNIIADNFYGALTSIDTHSIAVFGSIANCRAYRAKAATLVRGLSACVQVQSVEAPPLDPAQLPDGVSWSCLPTALRAANTGDDTCFRATSDCESARRDALGESSESSCVTRKLAVLYTTEGGYFAFRTADECRTAQASISHASRCAAVGSIDATPAVPTPAVQDSGESDSVPEALDRAAISTGIAAVKAKVTSCRDSSETTGKVKLHVRVRPDGSVAAVDVESAPSRGLGECVARAVRDATFARTQKGGAFSYPFVF